MSKVDMHVHTCASDGTWDVYELKKEILKNKISIFSITDHDCIDNVRNMDEILSPKDNLVYLHGVELTTEYENREYHLTLYNYDLNNEELIELMNSTNNKRLDSNKEYIEKYASMRYDNVTVEDFERYEYDRRRGGWKSANYMIDKGIHLDLFSHLMEVTESGYKAMLKGAEETMKIAQKSGGKIFLAHPSYHYKNGFMPEKELKYWLELGIDGVECYSPYNQNSIQYYVDFCKKNDLMISGGSDCHGSFIGSRKLGVPEVNLCDLNIKNLLK